MKKIVQQSILIILITSLTILGQVSDSLKNYNLNAITVTGALILEPESFVKIPSTILLKKDAGSLFDLGKKIPSIKIQTNSRGESLFYFRGSGERQITIFIDGIPINIPWDNRIDLSLLPADIVKEVAVIKGIPPAIFGANAISGVINLSTINALEDRNSGKLGLQLSENNSKKISGLYSAKYENLSYLISASYRNSDGFDLPKSFKEPFNLSDERINSYINTKNFFGKINYRFSDNITSGLLVSYVDSKKGVPPEIGVSSPRFWKYPLWKNFIVGTSGAIKLSQLRSNLFYSLSINKFDMQIDQYKNSSFDFISDIEKNDDIVYRARLIYTNLLGSSALLKVGFNGQAFKHDEEFKSSNFTKQTYTENILSLGAEYEYVQSDYVISIGGSIDRIETPKTGDKPGKASVTDYSANAAFVYSIDKNFSARINVGRKTRFPTLRETFSGALGRFVPNPSLKAEVAYSAESSFNVKHENLTADISLFYNLLKDAIVRISLPQRQFMRVNKDQIRTYGAELVSSYKFNNNLTASLNFTYLKANGKNSGGEFKDTLEYKPQLNSILTLDYFVMSGLNFLVEFEYIGLEYGLKEGSVGFQKLPDYLLTNFRIAYSLSISGLNFEIYLRANNLFDRLYYTQFGLPEAGRQFFLGANMEF